MRWTEFNFPNLANFSAQFTRFFYFVNDGSTDGTQQKLADFVNRNPERYQVINLSDNQGKAEAVRK